MNIFNELGLLLGSDIFVFLIFCLAAVAVNYILPVKFRNYWILAVGIVFYALCDLRFLALIAVEIVVSFYAGLYLGSKNVGKKKLVLITMIFAGILVFFKLFAAVIADFEIDIIKVAIPIGISYYTFRILSYLFDVYKKKREVEESFVIYAVYVSFFPHLLSGPIARSEGMTESLHKGLVYDKELFAKGTILIISGLFKKAVIADRMSGYVNLVFTNPEYYPGLALWIGAILYTIQLYCDFGGYSEVAIGITNMFGMKCESNFNRPYLSGSMREFWRRWHISFSRWLTDYIYIPLGGSRVKKSRHILNTMITFAVCGLWHRCSLNYLMWGIYHGVMNLLSPKYKKRSAELSGLPDDSWNFLKLWKRIPGIIVTFFFAMTGWIFFRADSLGIALRYIARMYTHFSLSMADVQNSVFIFTSDMTSASYAIVLFVMVFILLIKELQDENMEAMLIESKRVFRHQIRWSGLFIVCIILFGVIGKASFLYAGY